jgi:hypothetical protein
VRLKSKFISGLYQVYIKKGMEKVGLELLFI